MEKIYRPVHVIETEGLSDRDAIWFILKEEGWEEDKVRERLKEIEGNEKEELRKMGFEYQDSYPVTVTDKDGKQKGGTAYEYKKVYPVEDRPVSPFEVGGLCTNTGDLVKTIHEILTANKISQERINKTYQDFDALIELLIETKHQIGWKPAYSSFHGLHWDYEIRPMAVEPKKRKRQFYPSYNDMYMSDDDDYHDDYMDEYNPMGDESYDDPHSARPTSWSCNVCSGDESTGCLYFDVSECPRW
ncbi:MAG: hypothetical protein GC192_16960 [Bacteroidetes bacterium]|nr:hypothetical protein [Bacteroidota bacterium]